MLFFKTRINLQLFADGGGAGAAGDGGAGASTGAAGVGNADTGDTAVDAGRQKLLDLGVPEAKIRKNRTYGKPDRASQQAQPQQVSAANNNSAAEDNSQPNQTQEQSKRLTWDEIMADPEYNKKMQETVTNRLRTAKDAEAKLNTLQPAIELIAAKHGLNLDQLDYSQLAQAVVDDDQYYEDKALEMGVSIETAKQIDQRERQQKAQQQAQQQTIEQQMVINHVNSLSQQAEALKKIYPNFDLRKELDNPVFARLTMPNSGLSLEDAFFAVHRQEIQQAQAQATAQNVAKNISSSIASNARRPSESGMSGQSASVQSFNYANASPEQRAALKRRIQRGEKIIPGQEFR